ncbi:YheC/YheD family protein [Cohnella sp. CFH 77786]|uniref:YheC/YheD family endospore coat-associated protein n=1 Tax=Cohnella sp. CFH 77786 TaxID=2662265 RepID=UPI001C60D452|nr:YheC/YheD family protein [Cohnella sp. CFH 77786]MBW5447807.1 YheC/YheD family protein [Cohnella sp. CFH 77786]
MRDFYPVSEALGILVCERPGEPPFGESPFLRELLHRGKKAGLFVFAFDPRTWIPHEKTVRGWTRDDKDREWTSGRYGIPPLVYDRSWPETGEGRARFRQAVRKLEDARPFRYLNGKLPDKGRVYAVLNKDPELSRLLPPTEIYGGPASLADWLKRCGGSAFLKPACGSQGRRVAACSRQAGGTVRVRGRLQDNRPFDLAFADEKEALRRLHRWIGGRTYLMQPLLDLTGTGGEPCDIRVLVQKNGRGRWAVTGAAARSGNPGTVTANLHGGGTATPAEDLLAARHGPAAASAMMKEIRDGCRLIVRRLEQHYGHFFELGLDFGIDRTGGLWFLEANSKPGRHAMASVSRAAAEDAAARPIAYARYILLRPPGRVIHEFDHL